MKTTLRLMLPRLAELQPGTEADFALTEGQRVVRQGRLALAAIAAAVPASDTVAILHPADAILAEVTLPPLPPHQLEAAVVNAIEPLVLGDVETLAVACGPRAADGRAVVAWADRAWLSRGWSLLADAGLPVRQLVPAALSLPQPERGVVLAWRDHYLLARDAAGRGAVLALDPLADDTATDPAAAVWLDTLLETVDGYALLPPVPTWLARWRPPALDHGSSIPGPERAPDLDPSGRWLGQLPAWSLALPALRPRRLQASPWRRPLGWLAGAAAIWLLGLNVYAWQLQDEAHAIERRMAAQVREVFPQLPVILDPVRQATQQRDTLRNAGGQTDPQDFLPLALAAAQLLPAGAQAIQAIDYHEGALQLRFAATAEGVNRNALSAEVLSRAQQLGLQVDDVDGAWEIRPRDPTGALTAAGRDGAGLSITPGAQTTRDLNRISGASR
ncbi:MAG: type II secretion system protein GspL [Pigmentiphaga sp.]